MWKFTNTSQEFPIFEKKKNNMKSANENSIFYLSFFTVLYLLNRFHIILKDKYQHTYIEVKDSLIHFLTEIKVHNIIFNRI